MVKFYPLDRGLNHWITLAIVLSNRVLESYTVCQYRHLDSQGYVPLSMYVHNNSTDKGRVMKSHCLYIRIECLILSVY